jgi:hypothetical protein
MGNRIIIDENELEKLRKDVNFLKKRFEYKSNSIPLKNGSGGEGKRGFYSYLPLISWISPIQNFRQTYIFKWLRSAIPVCHFCSFS